MLPDRLYAGGAVCAVLLLLLNAIIRIPPPPSGYGDPDKLRQERNHASRELNKFLHKLSKAECINLSGPQEKHSNHVSSRGGWCGRTPGHKHFFDEGFAGGLRTLFENKTVASFGEGDGKYKRHLDSYVRVYDAYDGAAFPDEISIGPHVEFLDLAVPQYGLPIYDWVISTEVAEHIPAEFEAVYVSNLVRHAREGIVMSWAVPGQAGFWHVNLRDHRYSRRAITSLGFFVDQAETDRLRRLGVLKFIKNNVFVFRRDSSAPVDPGEA